MSDVTYNQPGRPFSLQMGIVGPTFQEQVAHLLPAEAHADLDHLQRDNEAISRLFIRHLLVQSAADKARDKLGKKVVDLLIKHSALKERKAAS